MKPIIRMRCNNILTSPLMDLALIFWCLMAFAATPMLMLRVSPFDGQVPEWLVLISGFAIGMVLLGTCRPMSRLLQKRLLALPAPWIAMLLGALLRLAWVLIFPSTPHSDAATYLELASALEHGAPYETAGTVAYWPVGYPLWLAGWLTFFDMRNAVALSQFATYIVGFIGIYQLAHHLSGEGAARIAVWSFAIWPNLLAQLATPEKESLVLALLPWVMLCAQKKGPKWWTFAAGLALGFSILVQPSLQLLLPLVVLMYWMRSPAHAVIAPVLLLILGTALVVFPWTMRNVAVLGVPVLVSTNGGENLYRANNPLATGGYTAVGERDLTGLTELERDRQGKRLAFEWIRENPSKFVALAFEKQLRFMGDDSPTIYASLKLGGGTQNMLVYSLLKIFANVWWLLIWLVLALAVMSNRCEGARDERWLIWSWLYLFALHSIFESAGKYHLPMIWALCVMLGCLTTRPFATKST